MPDYAEMYRRLFRSQTQAIEILQKAQRETEEMYISACQTELILLDKPDGDGERPIDGDDIDCTPEE